MSRLRLHHVQLARIGREAMERGDVDTHERAARALVGCCDGSVGDDGAPVNAGTLPQLLFALEAEARGFRWSERTLEWADSHSEHTNQRAMLAHARESARANVTELVRASQAALRQGENERAIALYQRALQRWARFEQQAQGLTRRAVHETRGPAERWTDQTEQWGRDVNEAVTPDSPFTLPLVIVGLLALLFMG